jgi:hypothetical protein
MGGRLHEDRARHGDLAGQGRESQWIPRPLAQQRERPTDRRIPQGGEPAGLARRQRLEMGANNLDEHQLRKARQDQTATGPSLLRFLEHTAREAREPPAGRPSRDKDPGQRVQQGIERPQIASEELVP